MIHPVCYDVRWAGDRHHRSKYPKLGINTTTSVLTVSSVEEGVHVLCSSVLCCGYPTVGGARKLLWFGQMLAEQLTAIMMATFKDNLNGVLVHLIA